MASNPPSDPLTTSVRPYPHQVGGHGLLAATTSGTVIKPSSQRELEFYKFIYSDQLPSHLSWIKHNTPRYFGEAPLPDFAAPSQSSSTPVTQPTPSSGEQGPQPNAVPLRWRVEGSDHASVSISPWAARMKTRKKHLYTAALGHPPKRPRPCVELEDINNGFIIPCVMDCKIGTRHYDDDASEAKRQRHIWKARSTTSAKCGVRYVGMQSFKMGHADTMIGGSLEHRDKYLGRRITEADLVPWATWFFHDGTRVRRACVDMILRKVAELREKLHLQKQFFFYSSSLLLVYEGASEDLAAPKVDVRMIDFAHTVPSNGHRDDGYVLGIDYLVSILEMILKNEANRTTALPKNGGALYGASSMSMENGIKDHFSKGINGLEQHKNDDKHENHSATAGISDASVAEDNFSTTFKHRDNKATLDALSLKLSKSTSLQSCDQDKDTGNLHIHTETVTSKQSGQAEGNVLGGNEEGIVKLVR